MAFGTGVFGVGHFSGGLAAGEEDVIPIVIPDEDVTAAILYHDTYAQRRLLTQYKDSDLKSLMTALFGNQVQDIEDAIQGIYSRLDISSQVAAGLDRIGSIVGRNRLGAEDEMYRYLIRAKIAENTSNGKIETILNIWNLITLNLEVALQEHYQGEVALIVDTPVPDEYINIVFDALQRVVDAGCSVTYVLVYDPDEAFGFEEAGPNTFGFSDDADPDGGGKLSYLQIWL